MECETGDPPGIARFIPPTCSAPAGGCPRGSRPPRAAGRDDPGVPLHKESLAAPIPQTIAKSGTHRVLPRKLRLFRFDPPNHPPPSDRPGHRRTAAAGRAVSPSKRQTACKPGSVPPLGCRAAPRDGDGHSSGTPVAGRLVRPTRAAARRPARRRRIRIAPGGGVRRSYLVLLPVGFSVPPPLPAARCALTAPFHPCRPPGRPVGLGGVLSVALSLGSPRRALPGTVPPWSPDFPLPAVAKSGRPAVWQP